MRISDALRTSSLPLLEAEVLLSTILDKDRSWLLAHGEDDLPADKHTAFQTLVSRRRRGEPVAYITGAQEFFGRSFSVNPHVLIPRPSTEGLVALTMDFLRHPRNEIREIDSAIIGIAKILKRCPEKGQGYPCPTFSGMIADIGTGSGCIAVTLACEVPGLRVIAVDLSQEALEVASKNAKRLGVLDRIQFVQGNLLEPLRNATEPFLVVSNPPYIPEGHELPKDIAEFEPRDALYAGEDGKTVLRSLAAQAREHPYCCGFVVECQEDQTDALLE